jgi:hypothetical protein
VYEFGSKFFVPLCERSPFPFYKSKGRECVHEGSGYTKKRERERERERERSPQDRAASPPLRMGPAGPIDDDGGTPMPRPSAMCGMCPNGTGGTGLPSRRMGNVHPAKMDDVSPPACFMA